MEIQSTEYRNCYLTLIPYDFLCFTMMMVKGIKSLKNPADDFYLFTRINQ